MSVSLLEVIEAAHYDLTKFEDANWLLSKRNEFDSLVEEAEKVVEDYYDAVEAIEQAEYEAEL